MSLIVMRLYDEFIISEKKYSSKFLTNNLILNREFDIEFYDSIKIFFHKEEVIIKICEIIEDIIKSLGLSLSTKYLVLGDFLFSMSSSDLSDPANFIFKTSRSDYINRIKLRGIINMEFNIDYKIYILMHKKLLIGLKLAGILEKRSIRSYYDKWETEVYFEFNIGKDVKFLKNIGNSKNCFEILSIMGTKYLVGSFRNIWKAKRKRIEMEDFAINYDGLIRANRIGLCLSEKIYNLNKIHYEKEKEKILSSMGCQSIKDYYNKILNIISEKKYLKKKYLKRELLETVELKDAKQNRLDTGEEYTKLLSNFQKVKSFELLEENLFNKIFYLPSFADNRGRQYHGTLISPTFYKMYRYMYEFGKKEIEFKDLKNSLFYKKIIKYKSFVKEYTDDDLESYILIVLLIEVGKFFIKTEDFFVKTEDLIKIGIVNYEIKNLSLDFEDIIYLNKIYYTLDRFLYYSEIDLNTTIFKDATSSGLQNYGIIIGYKKDMLEYINLDGENWCDTYKFLIDKFLKKNLEKIEWENNKIGKELLDRKYWKNTIMTIPYNAVWFSCFAKTLKKLRENGVEYSELSENDKEKLNNIHHEFYNDIKKNIKEIFYDNSKKELINFTYKKITVVNKKEYKINYKEGRDKYTGTLYMENKDEESTKKALEANNMHYRDSELVREIIKKYDIIPVHDCFGMRLCEVHLIIDEVNKYYSKNINKETYCIHVLK